jgi:glutathione S-transferase
LFGALSLVDLNFVPAVLRLFRHKPDFAAFPLVAQWGEMLLARSSVQEWLAEADSLEHVWYDDYSLPAL